MIHGKKSALIIRFFYILTAIYSIVEAGAGGHLELLINETSDADGNQSASDTQLFNRGICKQLL